MIVALENTAITLVDGDTITELGGGGVTADINVTILNNTASGGEGLLLALNDAGATGDLWIQLLTGSAPVAALPLRGITSSATAATVGAPVARTVPKIYTGSYTGTYIGAFGLGIEATDLTAADTIQDLLAVTQTPPNNVTFTVSGLVSGEDRVLVGPRAAGVLEKAQDTTNGILSSATQSAITMLTAIPSDTPTAGTIRVQLDTGVFRRQPYLSYTGSVYTIASTDYSGANQAASGNDQFVAYIDELAGGATAAFTAVYNTNRDLLVRVRDGGATPIKTFEAPAVFGASNTTVAAIRTSDA
mgnify:FL=1